LTAALACGLPLLAGCGRPAVPPQAVSGAVQRELRQREKEAAPLDVETRGGAFSVDDEKGRRLIEAKVGKMTGSVRAGVGLHGPVRLETVECRLFQDGKPQMTLKTPAAVWDGKQLVSDKTVHAVTTDGRTVIDARKATWTAEGGRLLLERAKLQGMKGGKVDFTAEGPRADVLNGIVTMPAGGTGRSAEGQQLTAGHVRWNLDTSRLEAHRSVVLTDAGLRVAGERLVADTKLKKGRLTGGTRVLLQDGKKLAQAKGNG
jgi:hypothetical protein